MMNIVIVGAGDVGRYLSEILSKERFNVILVDIDEAKLGILSQDIDVAVRHGDGTDWQLLDDLLELSPDFLIALTGSDEVNMVSAAIAKNLGYKETIARVKDNRYLNRTRLDFGRIFDVDHFVGPEVLVANDIYKFMASPGSLTVENFAHGAVQLRTLVVPTKWRNGSTPLNELSLPPGMMVGLIRRRISEEGGDGAPKKVLFPHGDDVILPGDEVTVIGETDVIADIHFMFGSVQTMVKTVVIIGGSLTARNLASILEGRDVHVRIIEREAERCCWLADSLSKTTVIRGDGTNIDLLMSEKVDKADIVVSATRNDEMNLTAALLAKEAGSERVVMLLSDTRFSSLVDKLGIAYTVSPRISATNRILSLVRARAVTSMVSVYEHQAEIAELRVSADSKVVGIPIAELGPQLPKDFLIAVIQNRGRIMVANGRRILSPGDTVIVVTHPKHISELEKVF